MKKLTRAILVIGSAGERADMLYASGFSALDAVVYLEQGRKRILVVPTLELGRAHDEARGVAVVTPDELPVSPAERCRISGWALGAVRLAGCRKITVASTFPLGIARRLEKDGIRLTVVDGNLFPNREIKKDEEVRRLVSSQKAAVAAMRAATTLLRSSKIGRGRFLTHRGRRLTSEFVRAEIERTLMQLNCSTPNDTIVAGGDQAVDPHHHGTGPLRADQAIVMDIFPQHRQHGYWGDITRTVVRGDPSDALLAQYRAVKSAQAKALRMLKPRVSLKGVHRTVQAELEGRGYRTEVRDGVPQGFFHGTGHGVGLEIHETPRMGTAEGHLRKGHVVTVEPGLYYPGVGGVRIEDTVVITSTGYRILATFPKAFVL